VLKADKIMRLHVSIVFNSWNINFVVDSGRVQDSTCIALPLYHAGAFVCHGFYHLQIRFQEIQNTFKIKKTLFCCVLFHSECNNEQ
jgi:hypothetical protein